MRIRCCSDIQPLPCFRGGYALNIMLRICWSNIYIFSQILKVYQCIAMLNSYYVSSHHIENQNITKLNPLGHFIDILFHFVLLDGFTYFISLQETELYLTFLNTYESNWHLLIFFTPLTCIECLWNIIFPSPNFRAAKIW